MQDKDSASARTEWGFRRNTVRRIYPDRRTRVRLKPDRRRGFGRRKQDLEEAAALEKQLRAAVKEAEAFGSEDLRLAIPLSDLGVFYYRAGKYARAEKLHKRALAIRERVLGPTHADVARSLTNLAALYYAQGRYVATEPLLKRALGIVEELRGPEHAEFADALDNYADLLKTTGAHDEAATLAARAQRIRAKGRAP